MEFQKQREQLIKQIQAKGIKDQRVLEAMSRVPRHLFIPPESRYEAYEDYPVSIGEGQTISQPYTVAFMTELLQVEPGMKVLEVGTGSGYQAAVLAELGADVYTVERIKSLYEQAKKRLQELGYNVKVFYGDGLLGLPDYAPFDRIIVTATGPLQKALIDQLVIGGIMVAPIDDEWGYSVMYQLNKKSEQDYDVKRIPGFSFVPLIPGVR